MEATIGNHEANLKYFQNLNEELQKQLADAHKTVQEKHGVIQS